VASYCVRRNAHVLEDRQAASRAARLPAIDPVAAKNVQELLGGRFGEMPTLRMMLGYLFVRGGVHAMAYARALQVLAGVEMSKRRFSRSPTSSITRPSRRSASAAAAAPRWIGTHADEAERDAKRRSPLAFRVLARQSRSALVTSAR
jgi:Mn-containing catalase